MNTETAVKDEPASVRPVLRVTNARVHFGAVRALDGVDLELLPGEIHALLGHNGSGKSTLIKVLAGFHKPESGTSIVLGGEELSARPAGGGASAPIRFVHQDLGLVDELDAMDNFALTMGYMRHRTGRINWDAERVRALDAIHALGMQVDVTLPVGRLSSVDRSTVAIARALAGVDGPGTVLVLDEPTATLSNAEVRQLLDVLRKVRASGTAVLYVSHRLDEIFEIADRYTALRDGRVVGRGMVADVSSSQLVTLIAGHEVATGRVEDVPELSEQAQVFELRHVTGPTLGDVNLTVRQGEILGVSGLLGSGRDELPYAVVGESRDGTRCELVLDQKTVRVRNVKDAINAGVVLVPGERLREGLIAEFACRENATLPALSRLVNRLLGRRGVSWLSSRAGEARFAEFEAELTLPAGAANRPITTLSGGNQQKVLLAKWLWQAPRLLVLAEPTAGVDVGTRQAIYEIIRGQAAAGMAVIVASSDVDDLVELAHRVVTLRRGDVVDEAFGHQITTERLISTMEGIPAS